MSATLDRLTQTELSEIPVTIRNAGVAGAGGAGFPTYAKWERLQEVDHLLVNHQESEPNYYMDKWLGREYPSELASLFETLLEVALDTVVVSVKEKNRDAWMKPLEEVTNGTIYEPDDLPIDPTEESGVVFAYTDDNYTLGMESVLLKTVVDTVIGQDLPMDHGWIVQNTETLHNIYRVFEEGSPVTEKFVHVDGNTDDHHFVRAPVGTPATALLRVGGHSESALPDGQVIVDGGPGWCFRITEQPHEFGIRKRTNCVMMLDDDIVTEHTYGGERVNVLEAYDWSDGKHENEPGLTLSPQFVRIPLICNPSFEGVVSKSVPLVDFGDRVSKGEMIAVPGDGISNPQHASIDGEVTAVTDTHIEIQQEEANREYPAQDVVYWGWCSECGQYKILPESMRQGDPTHYICTECREGLS